MPTPETGPRYSAVSLTLHWLIAALLLGQILLVNAAEAEGPNAGTLMMLHKSGGIAILILTLARIGWRIAHPAIPLPPSVPGWQRIVARATHVLFYVALIVMPMTGWIAGSAAGRGFDFYGLFPWPLLPVGGGRETAGAMMDIHGLVVKGIYVLLALHVLGALKHQFVDRDGVLARMVPFLPARR